MLTKKMTKEKALGHLQIKNLQLNQIKNTSNMYKIIDNFLSQEDFLLLKKSFYSYYFPWYAGPVLPDNQETKRSKPVEKIYNFHFSHLFYSNFETNSTYYSNIKPLINKIDPLAVIRIKANLETRTELVVENGYHTDFFEDYENCTTAVYYINTNNGYTKFSDGSLVQSVENRLVTFDSRILHTGSTCTDESSRIVINLNYIKKDSKKDF